MVRSRLKHLVNELRRRHVFRVAVAYAVAAWVVIQVAVSVFPYIGIPAWIITAVIIATMAGFPIALVLAWMFQITPEDEIARDVPPADAPAGRTNGLAYVTLVVLIVIVSAGTFVLLRQRADRAGDSEVVAVLPFASRGNASFAYLSTGMVDMLSRNFDQVTELRSADPGTIIETAGKLDPNVQIGSEHAERVAERVNARYYVIGSVTENSGRIRIDASLHDRVRKQQVGSTDIEDDASRLFEMVDRVAADLLVDRFGAASQHLARTAVTMTSSLEALKDYLRGEQALRRAAYDTAVVLFQHATEADSTFALAYYRLAVTASLFDAATVSAPGAIARARAHGSRLSPRDRALVEALSAYTLGEADDAERRYENILSEHPDDMEAQFQLANVLYRYNALRGRSPHEARPHYEKLFAVDPDFFCPI